MSFSLDIFASLEQILNFGMVLKDLIPDPVFTAQDLEKEFLSCLTNIMQCVEEENDERLRSMVGCPRLVIEEDYISFFVDDGFKVQDMALMLGCSKQTIERRLHIMYNLSTQTYTIISDYQLDEAVLQICSAYPRCGEKLTNATAGCAGYTCSKAQSQGIIKKS